MLLYHHKPWLTAVIMIDSATTMEIYQRELAHRFIKQGMMSLKEIASTGRIINFIPHEPIQEVSRPY